MSGGSIAPPAAALCIVDPKPEGRAGHRARPTLRARRSGPSANV